MLLRGGLLIEPWSSYTQYTNNPRKQSIISYNNNIYVCSVSHQSGATFEENSSKFATIGGGSSGGSGIAYGGEWDLSTSVSGGNTVIQDIVLGTGIGASITNNVVTKTTPVLIPGAGGTTTYGSVTENIDTNFASTRWLSVSANAPSFCSVFLTEQSVTNYPTFFYNIIGLNTPNNSLIGIISNFATNSPGYTVIVYDKPNELLFQYAFPVSFPNNVDFKVGFNADNTITIIADGIEQVLTSTVNFPANLSKLLSFDLGIQGGNPHTIQSFTDVGRLPLQQFIQETVINPPSGAVDGVLYTVINSGTYNNVVLSGGETVVFYNNLTDILIIGAPVDENSLVNLINNTINTSIDSGAIYNKLQYINTRGSVPYVINKINETSGLLEFTDDNFGLVNIINVIVNGGTGRVYSTRFPTSVFGKGEFIVKVTTTTPVILNINGTYDATLKVINLTPNQQCTVVLAELVENQISILSIDIEGETTFSTPSTYVPLTTSNKTANDSDGITSRGMGNLVALTGDSLGVYGVVPPEPISSYAACIIDMGIVNNMKKFTFTFNTILDTNQYYCLSNNINSYNQLLKLANITSGTITDGIIVYCTSTYVQVYNVFNSNSYNSLTVPLPSILGDLRVDVEINIPEMVIIISFPSEGPEIYVASIPILPFMYTDQPQQNFDKVPHLFAGTLYLTSPPLTGFVSFRNGVNTNKTPIGSWVNSDNDELIIDYLIANKQDIVVNYVCDYSESKLIPFYLRGNLISSGRYRFKELGAESKGVYRLSEQYDTIKTFTAYSALLVVDLGAVVIRDTLSNTQTVVIRDPNTVLTNVQIALPFVTELTQKLEIIFPASPINVTFTDQPQSNIVYRAYSLNGTYSGKVTLLFTYNPVADCVWEII